MFSDADGISASDIYGLEHLVRMLAALPSMMGPVRAMFVVVVAIPRLCLFAEEIGVRKYINVYSYITSISGLLLVQTTGF